MIGALLDALLAYLITRARWRTAATVAALLAAGLLSAALTALGSHLITGDAAGLALLAFIRGAIVHPLLCLLFGFVFRRLRTPHP